MGLGAGYGVVFASVVASPLPSSIAIYFDQPPWAGWAIALFVFVTTAAPYFALFALWLRACAQHLPSLALPWSIAAAFAAAELLRGRLWTGSERFLGNPWALLGYSVADDPAWIQIAAWTGIYGVSFALACLPGALFTVALRWKSLSPATVLGVALAGVVPLLFVVGVGQQRLAMLEEAEPGTKRGWVALAQADLDMGTRWRSDLYGKHLDVYMEITREAQQGGRPPLVVWPEAAMTFFVEEEPLYRRALARLVGPGALLLAGGPRELSEGRFANSVLAVDGSSGQITGRYDKAELVPFSEYFPLPGVDFLRRRFGRIQVFEHGDETAPLATPLGLAGVVICNETLLPEVVAQRVEDGAAFLVSPSNDGWISDPVFAERMLHIARVRAVEQGRSLIRASTSGPSALIDPYGRILERTNPGERSWLRGQIPIREDRTPYSRMGDVFGAGCLTVAGLSFAWTLTRRRPSRPDDPAPGRPSARSPS